jgi:hypothetical protein
MAKRKQPVVKTLGRKLRPSNADRYLNCPASVVASQDLPAGGSTFYADKGTVVHAVIENCINTGRTPKSYLGEIVCDADLEVDSEMARSAEFCLDYIKAQGFTHVEAEQVVELPWIKNPDGEETTGKVDFVGYDEDFEVLKVGDYKNGYMPVPDDSYQFGMYLHALVMKPDSPYKHLKHFSSVLVQPNSKEGEIISERQWNRGELIKLQHLIEFTTKWVAKTKPSDLTVKDYCEGHWCKFCPLSKTDAGSRMCPKKSKELFDDEAGTKALDMAKKSLPAPSTMTPEQRALAISKRKEITKWLDDVYKLELANAEAGNPLKGLKLVEGRTKARYWAKGIDDVDICDALKDAGLMEDEVFDKKLVTPASVKKLLKGKIPPELDVLMTPDEKGLELVPEDDARSAADGSDLFD